MGCSILKQKQNGKHVDNFKNLVYHEFIYKF